MSGRSPPIHRSHCSFDTGLAGRRVGMAGALACRSWASSSCGWRAAIALRSCSFIPRPYRERAGWEGKQRELLRGESPVRAGVSRFVPGQRVRRFAHNPKVAGSNPAPATKETLWYHTFQRVSSRLEYGGQDSNSATFFPNGSDSEKQTAARPNRLTRWEQRRGRR